MDINTVNEDIPLHERRVALTSRHEAHTSAVLTTRTGVNPLLTASSALIYLGTQIEHLPLGIAPNELHALLTGEVKAFESQAQQAGYRANTILAARYALCSWIDETVIHLDSKLSHFWKTTNLLDTFQQSDADTDRFFLIMDRGAEEPEQHLDLLELLYLCIRLGYEGKYRAQRRGQNKLDTRADQLFELIRFERGDFSRGLLSLPTLPSPDQARNSIPTQQTQQSNNWWWVLTLASVLAIGYGYTQLNTSVNEAFASVEHTLNITTAGGEV